jgi:hypothetical protein
MLLLLQLLLLLQHAWRCLVVPVPAPWPLLFVPPTLIVPTTAAAAAEAAATHSLHSELCYFLTVATAAANSLRSTLLSLSDSGSSSSNQLVLGLNHILTADLSLIARNHYRNCKQPEYSQKQGLPKQPPMHCQPHASNKAFNGPSNKQVR